eukprot:scaffold487060_cov18-Prasinocladus_malaysianus.AAC.1
METTRSADAKRYDDKGGRDSKIKGLGTNKHSIQKLVTWLDRRAVLLNTDQSAISLYCRGLAVQQQGLT